jgi:predicted RNase H-like HicB family nuclease
MVMEINESGLTRFGILEQLRDNWPRQIEMGRISLLEKKTRGFTIEEIRDAVDEVLEVCQYPPNVRDMVAACKKIHAKRVAQEQRSKGRPKPGDVVDGVRTMTPSEARAELERIWEEHPEAFDGSSREINSQLHTREERKASLDRMIMSIWVKALKKCAMLDPNLPAPSIHTANQEELF